MNNEIPELWRICSSTSIKNFLDKNNKLFKVVDKGNGINSGEEICDYLATKEGWHKFSLKKRLEAEIITAEEYKYALKCYETIRKKLPDEFWKKKIRKDIYLIEHNLEEPILNKNIKNIFPSNFLKELNECILYLQKTEKGLITYKKISKYFEKKKNKIKKEPCIASGIKNLYKFYYNRTNLPKNF